MCTLIIWEVEDRSISSGNIGATFMLWLLDEPEAVCSRLGFRVSVRSIHHYSKPPTGSYCSLAIENGILSVRGGSG